MRSLFTPRRIRSYATADAIHTKPAFKSIPLRQTRDKIEKCCVTGCMVQKKMNILNTLKQSIYPIYSRCFSRAFLVEGVLKDSDVSCRCIIVDDSHFMNYFISTTFGSSFNIIRTWRIWIPSVQRLVKNPPDAADICIVVLPRRWEQVFINLYDFKSPDHVRQVIDLTGDWEDVKKRFHRKKKEIFNRSMRKNTSNYKISTDLADFDHFYHEMHVPHCRKQFGGFASIVSYEGMKEYFLKGFLLFVVEEGKAIAGSLCIADGETMIFRSAGVLNGDEEYVKRGAQTLLFFHMIRYAKDHNFCYLDAMHSRPFFWDGVYRNKREWGATVSVDNDIYKWIFFFNVRASEKAAAIIGKNPVIVDTNDGLMGLIGNNKAEAFSESERRQLARQYHAPGIEGLIFLNAVEKNVVTLYPTKDKTLCTH